MDFRLVPQILQYFPHSFSQDVWYVASRYMRLAFASGSEDKKKKPASNAKDWVQSLAWEDPLEKRMATHSSILAWRIPWTEEAGGPQSVGLQRVGHD